MTERPGRTPRAARKSPAPRTRKKSADDATTARAPVPIPRVRTIFQRTGDLLTGLDRGEFPMTAYLEGPSEPLKAALLAEVKSAWRRQAPEAPPARIFRAAESSVEEILSAYHGASLFHPRELAIVLDVEDLSRSAKKVVALAAGIARPSDTACLFLVESATDTPPKTLDPLRESCRVRIEATPPTRAELLAWARRRFKEAGLEAEPGAAEAMTDACENDALAFFNEIDKLSAYCGGTGHVRRVDVDALLRPVVGAELEEYLSAAARGDCGAAAVRLGRVLAAGEGEGGVLWALGNVVGGALGGWTRHKDISAQLRRRVGPRGLARALDAVYRAESAWKEGRADAVAVLEQATREVCAAE